MPPMLENLIRQLRDRDVAKHHRDVVAARLEEVALEILREVRRHRGDRLTAPSGRREG